ncbi:hypothetical protein HZA87_02015 [Candidatus Uhrbacteria bacterium]|nr:hypothetical protein [Candidatus Uhrbacteria bacterium]
MEAMIELALRRQAEEALAHALANPAKSEIARVAYQMVINGQTEAEVRASKVHTPKVDLAEERRVALEANFRKRGFEISVPKPSVSNTTLKRWRREGRELFYRPATALMSYAAWMSAHGQAKHWTVVNESDRAKVGWEDGKAGYWFTTQIVPACPQLNTSWNDLTASTKLLCLEEYVIVYWTHHDLTGICIDVSTWCWLRTRFGRCALNAIVTDGEVGVSRDDPDSLSVPYAYEGGRAVEVVKNAA